jgi:hypothetical protein
MIAHSNSANTPIICDASILPEPLEAIGGKLGVADGMLEGTMPEVSLQRPSIIFFGSGSGIEPTAIRFDCQDGAPGEGRPSLPSPGREVLLLPRRVFCLSSASSHRAAKHRRKP